MKQFKKLLTFSVLVFAIATCAAQADNKDVTITASGSGANQEDAKHSALRNAIEQAYGAFISSKTEMLNDQVVADEMASVSAGNIKSYEILNEAQRPDGRWGVTLKATVSIDKLTSFVEAKGGTIEIKGGMFALNIKQQLLNEQGEIKAIAEMVGLLHEPMQTAFDYTIKSGTPQSLDAESKNWEIPIEITATCNKNMDFCANYFIKTLAALSLSEADAETYKSLNKGVFPVLIGYGKVELVFNLRKETSLRTIVAFAANWESYTRLFVVQSGLDTKSGIGDEIYGHKFTDYNNSIKELPRRITYLTGGQMASRFIYKDKRTISDIEQMTGYNIFPSGVSSFVKNGGYIVYEKDGHGLVVSLIDIGNDRFTRDDVGEMKWSEAKAICEDLNINGYDDWRLPTKDEAVLIGNTLGVKNIGGFKGNNYNISYWTSTPSSRKEYGVVVGGYWHVDLKIGSASDYEEYSQGEPIHFFRAVRTF